ncbi:MAG TPA: TIGR03790 family protein [Candidatus Binatia bacterium]|jgi:uncharacterized protein (TIGR03790 family)|nr:TIGR03790 family protein [Candidatus Binatia bacterium]
MKSRWQPGPALVLLCALAGRAWAGGSGLNVLVVVNQTSTNSLQLGNYYCERRQVPPQNVLRINWTGDPLMWDISAFATNLYNPLLAMLAGRQLTNQIDYVAVCMDIPYLITTTTNIYNNNSSSSALFYGWKPDPNPPCSMALGSTNLYAGTEDIFRSIPPTGAGSNSFLSVMMTSSNLALAKRIVDSGVSSDSSFPTQTVYLAKSSDVDRNVRYVLFDNAIFDARLRGNYSMQQTNVFSIYGFGNILGFESGAYSYTVGGVAFAPGGLADNLTSYGGLFLTDNSGHLSILSLLAAGASGSYGTLSEPCNYLEKFPSPEVYFYQARGFTLAECYYQSLTNPYQGVLVGEPLAAPFAQPAGGSWLSLPLIPVLAGTTNLSLEFNASDANHPVQQVDLFLDGLWLQTLTNIPPQPNDNLHLTLNGFATNYFVPANATLQSVASNLTSRLNETGYSNLTKVAAFAHGDRIELRSMDSSKTGAQATVLGFTTVSVGSAPTTFIAASRTNFLDTIAFGRHNLVVNMSTNDPPLPGSWLLLSVTKTNGSIVNLGVTNPASGSTIPLMVSNLVNGVNGNPALSAGDGCLAADFIDYSVHVDTNDHAAEFNVYPRAAGWNAATIQVALTGSSAADFSISPSGTWTVTDNHPDLQPRNHLYVTAGVTNLALTFPFSTAVQADGFHELTAVVYEGSHVRTQKRVAQNIQIQNTSLAATFATLVGDTNSAVEGTLQFSVVASTNNISKIELFSTGGSLGSVRNQSNALFAVAGTNLGIGLHPFYALVTASSGKQYRTQTKWIRLIGADAPFPIAITNPPPTLLWPAAAGRGYDVLSTTNLATPFQLTTSLVPSNSAARWADTNLPSPQRFYRVRSSE